MPKIDPRIHYIQPGETCWAVHFNLLKPVRGVALIAMPEDQSRLDVRRNPNRAYAFAPFQTDSDQPDMTRVTPAYTKPFKPIYSHSAILFHTKQEAVTYWNGRVKQNVESVRSRMEKAIQEIEAKYITDELEE